VARASELPAEISALPEHLRPIAAEVPAKFLKDMSLQELWNRAAFVSESIDTANKVPDQSLSRAMIQNAYSILNALPKKLLDEAVARLHAQADAAQNFDQSMYWGLRDAKDKLKEDNPQAPPGDVVYDLESGRVPADKSASADDGVIVATINKARRSGALQAEIDKQVARATAVIAAEQAILRNEIDRMKSMPGDNG
jgi:hypothetical protein